MSIIQSADFSTFQKLATFKSIEEMNLSIRYFLYHHKHILNDSTITVLKTITRHACKVKGVCFLKIDTLVSKVSLSRSTVERAIRVLKKYGILTVKRTQRKQGGYGHNVFIIEKFESDIDLQKLGEVSGEVSTMTYRKEAENIDGTSTQHLNDNTETKISYTRHSSRLKERNNVNKRLNVSLETLDHTYVPSHVPGVFVDATSPFLNAYDIYRMFGVVQSAKRYMDVLDVPMSVILKGWKESVFAYKLGKIKKSLFAYFYGTLVKKIATYKRQQTKMYNWLECEY